MQSILDLFNSNKHNDVISLYLKSELRPQVDSDTLYIVAASYFKLSEYSECYQLLTAIQSSFEEDVNFLSLYAATCRHIGRLPLSQRIFLKALSIEPGNILVLNNYSNLLIDLHDYEKAYHILSDLVIQNPDYKDALINFERLKQIREFALLNTSTDSNSELSNGVIDQPISPSPSRIAQMPTPFSDPLLFAFSEDEVKRTTPFRPSIHSNSNSGALAELVDSFPEKDINSVAADQLNLACRAVIDGNSSFALKTCSHVLANLEKHAELYSCAADAFLSEKNFIFAELYFIHSISLGANTFKNNFNLASLACMKRDFGLAEHYLSVANSLDKSNPLVMKLKKQIDEHRTKFPIQASFSFQNLNPYDLKVSKI